MALPLITFSAPVKVERDSDFLADEAKILGIVDSPNYQKLVVTLEFTAEQPFVTELALLEGEAYVDLEDWTYESLQDRIKAYYESDPFAPPAPEPTPAPAPTPEPAPNPSRIFGLTPATFDWPADPKLQDVIEGPNGGWWVFAQPRNAEGRFLSDIPDTPEVESAPRWIPI